MTSRWLPERSTKSEYMSSIAVRQMKRSFNPNNNIYQMHKWITKTIHNAVNYDCEE